MVAKVDDVTTRANQFLEAYKLKVDGIIVDTHLAVEEAKFTMNKTNMLSIQLSKRLDNDIPTLMAHHQQILNENRGFAEESRSKMHVILDGMTSLPQTLGPVLESFINQSVQSVNNVEQSILDKLGRWQAAQSNLLRELLRNQLANEGKPIPRGTMR